MPTYRRRRLLRLSGAAIAAALAGCSADGSPTETREPTASPTESRAPTATATETESATETASPTPGPALEEAWRVGRLSSHAHRLLLPEVGPAEDPAGPLYAATHGGQVARIGADDGRHAWTTAVHGEAEGTPALAPIGDTLYAVSETFTEETLAGHLEAVDPRTGEVRWRLDDRYFLRVLGAVDDLVVVAGEYIKAHPDDIGPMEAIRGDGKLYGLDRSSGDVRWTVAVPELRGADVAAHGVYAAVTRDHETHQLSLRALNLDGTDRWRVDTGTINPGAPLATDGLLLAGAGDDDETDTGGVGRYDPADGSLRWRAGTWGRGPDALAVAGGTIHAGGRPLLALDPDGRERWRLQTAVVPEVATTPETLYNGAGSTILAIDRGTGTVRWRHRPVEHDYTHVRAVLADHLAVDHGIGPDHEIVLLDEMTGDIVGTYETADSYSGTVGAGRRLFASVGSDVVAYDVLDG